jgi:putative endonuclease
VPVTHGVAGSSPVQTAGPYGCGIRKAQDVSNVLSFLFFSMFYVYINYSEKFDSYYIGQTKNFQARIILHNKGLVASSKPYCPWQNVLLIEKNTRAEAMALEKKLKNLNRTKLLAFILKYK